MYETNHSLSYYWKDTRLTVYIWQPFEARIIWTCRSGLQIKYWDLRSAIKYWDPRSAVQTVRPLVCSSNSETPGLQFKQWDPWSAVQILRPKVWSSNIEIPGLQLMKCRPGLSVFEPQTLVLSIWAPDLGSHCLNCRPGVALFELQTRGLTVWTTDLGSQYLITDLRHQYQTHPTLKSSLVGRGRSPKKTPKPSCQVMSVVAKGLRKEFFRWYSTERPEPTEAT